jgi:hypothetical protein
VLAVDGLVDSETYRGLSYMLDPNLPHLGGGIAAEKENSPYIASTGLMLVNNCR